MKNFRWIAVSLFFLLSLLAGVQSTEASDIHEDQKPDSKKLAHLHKKLEHLRIPLSGLQLLLMDNSFKAGKKKTGGQYLALEEARGFGKCFYFFSVQVDSQSSDHEDYGTYFHILENQKYKEKVISPLTMRVLGAYGKKDKDYYQGTYEIRHGDLSPFRFHLLAIEMKKEQQLKQGVAFYVLSGNSRQDSVQLSALCKEEYAVTKEGKFIDEEGNLIMDGTERWVSLEEVIGEKILQKVKEKPSRTKKSVFMREKKLIDPIPLPSQSMEPESALSRTNSVRTSPLTKPLSLISSEVERKETSSPPERRKGNFTLLDEEIKDLLHSMHENEVAKMASQKSSSFLPTSSQETVLTQEAPIPSSSNQEVSATEKIEGDRTPSPSLRRGRNPALVDKKASELLQKK